MFKTAKNLKDQILQFIPSFAGELDTTKVFQTIDDLELGIANKEFMYPGKIVFVLETKKYYIIDLEIDGNSSYPNGIRDAWIAQMNSLSGYKDILTVDYELAGYSNVWVYDYFIKTDLNVPSDDGYLPISKDSDVNWVQSDVRFVGDIDDSIPTEIARIDLLTTEGIKILLYVSGENGLLSAKYSSTIMVIRDNDNIKLTEYGVVDSQDLDITFDCVFDLVNDEWVLSLKKNSTDYTIINTIMKVQIIDF